MAKGLNLKAVLSLESKQFKAGINSVKKELNGLSNIIKSAFALGSIAAFGKKMVQVGAEFENAMARVQAVSNATTEDFAKMRKEAERLGSTTKYTATEAANALENLTRNGLSATQATKALAGTLQLAQANSIDLANAADILTNTLNAFGLSVNQTERVNDVLSSTAANAATNINELYEAMIVAGPYAKIMGKSVEETAAALGTLANQGIKGSNAGKTLAAMYQRIAAVTPKSAKAFAEFGVHLDETAVKSQSLYETLSTLQKSGMGQSVEALSNAFGKNFAGNIAQLINSLEDFDTMLHVTQNSAGTTARMSNQSVGSVKKELDTLKSAYEGLLITISTKTSGVVKSVIKLLQNLVNNFKTTSGTIMNLASVVVPLLAANFTKAARAIMIAFRQIQAGAVATKLAIGNIVGVVLTLITWVGTGLVGAWNKNNQAMKDANQQLEDARINSERTQTALNNLTDKLGPDTDKDTLAGIVKRLCELFPEFASAIKSAAREAGRTGNWDKLKQTLQDIKNLQDAVSTKDAREAIANAQAEALGGKLFNRGNSPGWYQYWDNPYRNADRKPSVLRNGMVSTDGIYALDEVAEKINKSLKDSGFSSKEARKQIFVEISKVLGKEGKEAASSLRKILDDYNVSLSDTEIENLIKGANSLSGKITYNKNGSVGGTGAVDQLNQTNRQIASADSTIVAQKLDILKKSVESELGNLEDDLKNKKIGKDEYNQKGREITEKYLDDILDVSIDAKDQIDEANRLIAKFPKPKPTTTTGGSGGGKPSGTTKTTDQLAASLTNYKQEADKLKNQLDAGAITVDEYNQEMQRLVDNTWKSVAALGKLNEALENTDFKQIKEVFEKNRQAQQAKSTDEQRKKLNGTLPALGVRDTTFDFTKTDLEKYGEDIELQVKLVADLQEFKSTLVDAFNKGEFNLLPVEDVNKQLDELTTKIQDAQTKATEMQNVLQLTKITQELKELNAEYRAVEWESISSVADTMDRLYRSLQNVADAFGVEIKWEGFEKFMAVLNFAIQTLDTVNGLIKAITIASELYAQVKQKDAAKIVSANMLEAASEGTKASAAASAAAAGAAESQAAIPVVGPVLAVAAVAAVVGAIMAGMSKFAKGGIVGGNSYSGDKNLVRANTGEMILTGAQQATLFNAINSGRLGGGDVEFKIRGVDLVGTINNYNKQRRG